MLPWRTDTVNVPTDHPVVFFEIVSVKVLPDAVIASATHGFSRNVYTRLVHAPLVVTVSTTLSSSLPFARVPVLVGLNVIPVARHGTVEVVVDEVVEEVVEDVVDVVVDELVVEEGFVVEVDVVDVDVLLDVVVVAPGTVVVVVVGGSGVSGTNLAMRVPRLDLPKVPGTFARPLTNQPCRHVALFPFVSGQRKPSGHALFPLNLACVT